MLTKQKEGRPEYGKNSTDDDGIYSSDWCLRVHDRSDQRSKVDLQRDLDEKIFSSMKGCYKTMILDKSCVCLCKVWIDAAFCAVNKNEVTVSVGSRYEKVTQYIFK